MVRGPVSMPFAEDILHLVERHQYLGLFLLLRIFWPHPLIWGTAGLLLLAAAVLVVSLWRNSRSRERRI